MVEVTTFQFNDGGSEAGTPSYKTVSRGHVHGSAAVATGAALRIWTSLRAQITTFPSQGRKPLSLHGDRCQPDLLQRPRATSADTDTWRRAPGTSVTRRLCLGAAWEMPSQDWGVYVPHTTAVAAWQPTAPAGTTGHSLPSASGAAPHFVLRALCPRIL